jgi:predicted Zn-dependent peptidase
MSSMFTEVKQMIPIRWRMARRSLPALAAVLLLMSVVSTAPAQDLASFEEKTTVHTLKNGWTFIVVERPVAPVFSFATYANVGGAQEIPGITGLAHMFEHMAFKGTPNIGTNNYKSEKRAIEELEAAYQAMQTERLSSRPDGERMQQLEARFKEKETAADQYVIKNEFGDILDREGGTGLNAFTNSDFTGYFYSLPANKFELMAYLESERFLHPVFREFYKERDVVKEERRLRTESQPIGRMIEQFVSTAFMAHPYHQPVVGYMSDLNSITITDAEAFYQTYYVPSNLVTAVVGDVKAEEIIPVIEKYFGRIPAGPKPPALRTVEPTQIAEKTVILKDPSQPIYAEAYHKPAATDIDQPIYDAIDDVLSNGRTSRLHRSLAALRRTLTRRHKVRIRRQHHLVQDQAVFTHPHVDHVFAQRRDLHRHPWRSRADPDAGPCPGTAEALDPARRDRCRSIHACVRRIVRRCWRQPTQPQVVSTCLCEIDQVIKSRTAWNIDQILEVRPTVRQRLQRPGI